ncbi:MAG: tRNA (adenosine(37)-N6)-threonylcarbamoyltransferase complex ATPase subunit type 1 TsaE [Chloroflexi bacterium]|nr:tRNA (adenosine(37)-N6)-threonylcarbamoyltransferase complex ATPase subunit type 1 TsaE [Chloroflexota bacterium]
MTDLERELHSPAPEATFELGRRLASAARPGDVICLWGELGAGKTVLAKGVGAGLAVTTPMSSPSFILMAEHAGRLPLFHLDLYRLASADEAIAGGLLDGRQASGVTIIEWPDRLGPAAPSERLDVHIDGGGDDVRSIRLRAIGEAYRRYLDAATDVVAGATRDHGAGAGSSVR